MTSRRDGFFTRLFQSLIEYRLVVVLLFGLAIVAGMIVSPFDERLGSLPKDSIAVDAIPDLGDNQQIVFTRWPGRSPRDVEDQVTYPLTTSLLGIAKVKSVRSQSMFGFSSIYVIFEEDAGFYWSRSRLLEKLSSLPRSLLPEGVEPTLGPDATALGQVYWYTLEGRDPSGKAVGGWSLDELRSVQDWTIRYALQAVSGVSEVASVGGHVKEYQVDVNPESLRAHDVTIEQVAAAVRHSNHEVGARTLEINRAEYVVRSRGFVGSIEDIESSVVTVRGHVPIRVTDVARVSVGPSERRGALDDSGAEAVGGVVVARFGANPLSVVESVKQRIAEIEAGLPSKVLEDGTTSRVTIVPFYDRSGLIHETLGTLSTALWQQILITILVVLVMLRHLRGAALISMTLPLAVFLAFLAMKIVGVEANIMSLAGIAIAIGTMVDMGIVLVESIVRRLQEAEPSEWPASVAARAAAEVAPAVLTSAATTIVSFLPIFAMTSAEGKLFRPLAYTKSFALVGAALLAVLLIPTIAPGLLRRFGSKQPLHGSWERLRRSVLRPRNHYDYVVLAVLGGLILFALVQVILPLGLSPIAWLWIGLAVFTLAGGLPRFLAPHLPSRWRSVPGFVEISVACIGVGLLLAADWRPLGEGSNLPSQAVFVALTLAVVLGSFTAFRRSYKKILRWFLGHKALFAILPLSIVIVGFVAWRGATSATSWIPGMSESSGIGKSLHETFPGIQSEFMPSFDEGSFLFMPTTTPHASVGQAIEQLRQMDAAIATIPEVTQAVGKLGRAETALDPAPVSMFETVINYQNEWGVDESGKRVRQWRDHIKTPDDIWNEVIAVTGMPGVTSAPKLMPIETRLLMLQTGMRAPVGLKIYGDDLKSIEDAGRLIEPILRRIEGVDEKTVSMDQVVGKPYIEIELDRHAIARFGLTINAVQRTLQLAVGGVALTRTVEGRERYPVRVRYMREERDSIEALKRVFVAAPGGEQIPLSQLAKIEYSRGPQSIKSEDAFKVAYLLFATDGTSAVEVVERAEAALQQALAAGELVLPDGVSHWAFAGAYENQLHSEARFKVLLPLAAVLVLLLLYLQFRRLSTVIIIGSSVLTAVAGGLVLLWLFGKPWFLDVELFDVNLRALLHIAPQHMSSAVWVGIIALIGIATDDGVVMGLYLKQRFEDNSRSSIQEIQEQVIAAGCQRIRACLMTTATTLLALLPVLTSTGRGADIMVPMAIPIVGGMIFSLISLFVVPVAYCWVEEWRVS